MPSPPLPPERFSQNSLFKKLSLNLDSGATF